MLTDTALRNMKPKSKIYKGSDRDGMCVTVSPSGTVPFRYDYRLNGRRETLILGLWPRWHFTGHGARAAPRRAQGCAQGRFARD